MVMIDRSWLAGFAARCWSLALTGALLASAFGGNQAALVSAWGADDFALASASAAAPPSDQNFAASVASNAAPLMFGIYPGGATGETPVAPRYTPTEVLPHIQALRGSRPFSVNLYTAWAWHDGLWFDPELQQYLDAGLSVSITVRFYPPEGHAEDVAGYAAFVRDVARRYGAMPGVIRLVIGNEGNVGENPHASDGYYPWAPPAIVAGTLAAREELQALNSSTQLSINFATVSHELDTAYLQRLVAIGGPEFLNAISVVSINTYPGVWSPSVDDPYQDMLDRLTEARSALTDAGFPTTAGLDVLENGFPTPDEGEQAARLTGMARAALDHAAKFGVVRYVWFNLWDANSGSTDRFGHYGVLRSDLSRKPAFERYRDLIDTQSAAPTPNRGR